VGLSGVSFRITHGQSIAIVGANGAGKSTLLLQMTGCLLPTEGRLQVGDVPVGKQTLTAVRRSVGMVFQNPDDQLFMPTVFEDVAFGPLNLGIPPQQVQQLVTDALERVGVSHLRNRPPYKLSAGEKRRAAIATVLAMSPDILVMDEPSANLDPKARRELIELLKTFEHTKIIATHDLDMAMELCPRTLVLNEGKVLADDATETIFRNTALLKQARLEQPLSMQKCPVCSRQ
jgi:cobalt/nickel transport system ATP-binding protein